MSKKLIEVDAQAFDDLMYWLDRCAEKGHLEKCGDLVDPWAIFDANGWRVVEPAQPAAGEPVARELLRQAFRLISTTVPEGVAAGLDDPSKQAWWYRECNPTATAISEYLSKNPAPPAAAHGDEAVTLRLPSEKPYDYSEGPAAFAANFANAAWNHCIAKIKELNPGMNAVVELHRAGEGDDA